MIWQGMSGPSSHGFGFSPDGNRMYLSDKPEDSESSTPARCSARPEPAGARPRPDDLDRRMATQHSIPVTYDGNPYLFTVDEGGSGGVKLIDVADDANPKIVGGIKLEINLPENIDSQIASAQADRPSPTMRTTAPRTARESDGTGMRLGILGHPGFRRAGSVRRPGDRLLQSARNDGSQPRAWNSPHALASISGSRCSQCHPFAGNQSGQFIPPKR